MPVSAMQSALTPEKARGSADSVNLARALIEEDMQSSRTVDQHCIRIAIAIQIGPRELTNPGYSGERMLHNKGPVAIVP